MNIDERILKPKNMKRIKELGISCLLTLCFSFSAYSENRLVAYPAPDGAELNDDFTVKIRQAGQAWRELPSYLVKVDELRDSKHNAQNASMSYFDFSGEVEVSGFSK
jgi:hypothetical protein